MSSGLLALLDDIAAIAKVAAASLDDVAAQTVKASGKAAGIVIDDAAVTPKYVVGLSPARELPIVWNIAKGSIKNKLVYLLPALLVLGSFAPWLVTLLLAVGGVYLSFEGYEKLHHYVVSLLAETKEGEETRSLEEITPEQLEAVRTKGAIRTDLILSAEIMAISYAQVVDKPFIFALTVLVSVALLITIAVYGSVALILKADDVGKYLATQSFPRVIRVVGRSLVKGMPLFLRVLATVGTFAMLWVGGQILIHSVPVLHHELQHYVEYLQLVGFSAWLFEAGAGLIAGIAIGWITELILVRLLAASILFKKNQKTTQKF